MVGDRLFSLRQGPFLLGESPLLLGQRQVARRQQVAAFIERAVAFGERRFAFVERFQPVAQRLPPRGQIAAQVGLRLLTCDDGLFAINERSLAGRVLLDALGELRVALGQLLFQRVRRVLAAAQIALALLRSHMPLVERCFALIEG